MLPPENPNIPLKNYLLKLREDIKILGISTLLKKWHSERFESYASGAKEVGISATFYREIILGNLAMPIRVLKLFSKKDISLLKKIYSKRVYFTARKKSNLLPKTINPKLAYIIGYLHGDGHIDSNGKRVSFFDKYFSQLEIISELMIHLFEVGGNLYLNKAVPTLDLGRVTINSFLTEVIGITRGKRKSNKIPEDIQKNKILLKWYLCGLFDAEGSMPLNPKKRRDLYIDIAMKDENLISIIGGMLEEKFDILSYGPYKRLAKNSHSSKITLEYELKIRKLSEIKKFFKVINTLHPDKIRRKNLILDLLNNRSLQLAPVAQPGIRAFPS